MHRQDDATVANNCSLIVESTRANHFAAFGTLVGLGSNAIAAGLCRPQGPGPAGSAWLTGALTPLLHAG